MRLLRAWLAEWCQHISFICHIWPLSCYLHSSELYAGWNCQDLCILCTANTRIGVHCKWTKVRHLDSSFVTKLAGPILSKCCDSSLVLICWHSYGYYIKVFWHMRGPNTAFTHRVSVVFLSNFCDAASAGSYICTVLWSQRSTCVKNCLTSVCTTTLNTKCKLPSSGLEPYRTKW